MADTLTLWHAEHVNFAWLLSILEKQVGRIRDDASPEYELMLDVMHYMTHYSDVVHHPREDLVFAIVKDRDASAASKVDELVRQHEELKEAGNRLVEVLNGIVNGTLSSRGDVEVLATDYITGLRGHMRMEESAVLPLAARLLRESDWSDVQSAIAQIEDPLFGGTAETRYSALREQIVREVQILR